MISFSARVAALGALLLCTLGGCGDGVDGGGQLGLTVYTNNVVAGQTFELRVFADGTMCPTTLNLSSADLLLNYPLCGSTASGSCAARKESLAAGQSATLKDIPVGPVTVLVTSPAGDAPNSGGCGTATIAAGQIANATITVASF